MVADGRMLGGQPPASAADLTFLPLFAASAAEERQIHSCTGIIQLQVSSWFRRL